MKLLILLILSLFVTNAFCSDNIFYFRCEEASGNLTDSSGHGHTATANGDGITYQVSGAPNRGFGITLDGSSDYFEIADHANFTVNDFSMGGWVKVVNSNTSGSIMWKYDGSTADGYLLEQLTVLGGKWVMEVLVGGVSKFIVSNSPPIVGIYQHIYVTRESGVMKMYVNGVKQTDEDTNIGEIDSTANFRIGRRIGFGFQDFTGSFDELKFFNYALSATWMQHDYVQSSYRRLSMGGFYDTMFTGINGFSLVHRRYYNG